MWIRLIISVLIYKSEGVTHFFNFFFFFYYYYKKLNKT